ncbi:hypothetical protein ACEQ8H_007617 [Pleosporales sp. CAS-2024a]
MQAVQLMPRKAILFAITSMTLLGVLFRFYGDVPVEYYRNYGPGEAALPPVMTQNTAPQPAYFKSQPEWYWDVPKYANSWDGYARTAKNSDIVVLTASDGGGHNSLIPNVLERVLEDRAQYCARHGYTHLWLNTSRYDVGKAHRTWSKIPAVAEAFYLYPNAEWVWLIDTDIILMNPDYDLVAEILSPDALRRGLMLDSPILDGQLKSNPTHINTPATLRVEDMDILITQDHQSVNTGSTFFRRTAFTRWTLEMMTDYTMLMGKEHGGAEQDALKHLMLEHQLVRNHVGIYPQRKFNAYPLGGDNMGYRDGDLLVHLAGCWVDDQCAEWFEEFWVKRGHKEPWRPLDGSTT